MVNQLFGQAGAVLNPITSIPIYSQVDTLLWNTMAGLPLFGEPALVVNGVRLGNVQYNPTIDGLLWNVQSWAKMVPKPAEKIS